MASKRMWPRGLHQTVDGFDEAIGLGGSGSGEGAVEGPPNHSSELFHEFGF